MNHICMHHARICNPHEPEQFGTIWVRDGKIDEIIPGEQIQKPPYACTFIDVEGLRVIPGFIDVHVHGGGGIDVMHTDVNGFATMSLYHAAHGTTSFLATTITAQSDVLEKAVSTIQQTMASGTPGAEIVGIHLEGPYLNPLRTGAQNPQHLRTGTIEELARLMEKAAGHIRLMTIAPEMTHAKEVIQYARLNGITVSIGHSDASHDQMKEAVEWGASHVTHLFNGMRPIHHREPGTAGAALTLDALAVELICDGIHVHPDLVDLVFRLKPKEKVVFITDCISAAGLEEGDYELGGLPIRVLDGQVRLLLEDGDVGSLAGSCLTMDKALRNGLAFTNRPLHEILPALTINPARQIGLDSRKGSIEKGKDADLVILDQQYGIQSTFVKGRRVYG